MKKKKYTENEIETINKLRKDGATWAQIAARTGRNQRALYSKFYKVKNKNKAARVTARAIQAVVPATHSRPMIALVGTPNEITKSLMELFS